jgi:hypothetical protein
MDSAVTIRTRAVATAISRGTNCVISLAETGTGINVLGTANVGAGCGVIANSTDDAAVTLVGTSYLDANPISAVGNISVSSDRNYPSSTAILPYGVAAEDPIAARGLEVPTDTGCDHSSTYRVRPSETFTGVNSLQPGRYCGGMNIQGTVNLNPGVYIMDGGNFNITSQATITGEGVTIIMTGDDAADVGDVAIAGGAEVDLSAPMTDGDPWEGMLFFQDPDWDIENTVSIAGDAGLNLEGIIYAPGGDMSFMGSSGGASSNDCLYLIADTVTIGGEASIDNACNLDAGGMNFQNYRIALVE